MRKKNPISNLKRERIKYVPYSFPFQTYNIDVVEEDELTTEEHANEQP